MADGLNKVMLIGNLGQDTELRYTQSQQGVLTMRLACNESWYDQTAKERKERVEWVTVVVWGKRGEGLHKILSKGSKVFVEGRLQTRKWQDKQGNDRYTTEVVATNVLLLGGKSEGKGGRANLDNNDRGGGSDDSYGGGSPADDDIPF